MWKTMAVATLLGSHGGLYTGVFAPDGEHVLRLEMIIFAWFSEGWIGEPRFEREGIHGINLDHQPKRSF